MSPLRTLSRSQHRGSLLGLRRTQQLTIARNFHFDLVLELLLGLDFAPKSFFLQHSLRSPSLRLLAVIQKGGLISLETCLLPDQEEVTSRELSEIAYTIISNPQLLMVLVTAAFGWGRGAIFPIHRQIGHLLKKTSISSQGVEE